MKRMIMIALLIGYLMGSVVLATCHITTLTSNDPNDPNNPGEETGLPSRQIIWLAYAADPNDPNNIGEE